MKNIILDFNQLIVNISLNPMFVNLKINFTMATDLDPINSEFENLLSIISTNIENNPDILELDIYYPKNNKIREMINKLMPEKLKKQVLDNYK
jgi:hypothetical protein